MAKKSDRKQKMDREFSRTLHLTVSGKLYARVKEIADQERRTLTDVSVLILEDRLGLDDFFSKMEERLPKSRVS